MDYDKASADYLLANDPGHATGVYNNAAAPSVRESHSFRWFEWEPSVGIAFPGAYGGTDFNNRGEKGIEQQIERFADAGYKVEWTSNAPLGV